MRLHIVVSGFGDLRTIIKVGIETSRNLNLLALSSILRCLKPSNIINLVLTHCTTNCNRYTNNIFELRYIPGNQVSQG